MRLRSEEELNRALSEDAVWRKVELAAHQREVRRQARTSPLRHAMTRAAIAMLYGHWEGYVKRASQAYLNYVTFQREPVERLTDNFYFIALWRECGSRQPSLADLISASEILPRSVSGRRHTFYENAINTRSNLSYSTLLEILDVCGLNGGLFSTKRYFIDGRLLDKRNHIAHGEYISVFDEDIDNMFDETVGLIDAFKALVENAVVQKKYLRSRT